MTIKTSPYNPLDYLKTEEEIIEYLNEAYLDDDPRIFVIALGYIAKAHGVAAIAKKTGLNRESLYKVFSGKTQPQWDTIQRVMKALNINIRAVT